MTYSQYLLQGGTVIQDEQMLLLMEIANLFKLDPMSVLLLVGEEQAPQLLEAMGLLAELTGDQELMSVVELVAQAISGSRSQAMKKGGTIKEGKGKIPEGRCGKKIKKAETGIELPKGAHDQKSTTVFGKGGCPCKLHKVGGRLIEIDGCTGVLIHRTGGPVLAYAKGDKVATKLQLIPKNSILNAPWMQQPSGELHVPLTAGESMFRARLVDKNQLSDYSLAGRRAWVRANSDYLRQRGWDDARIKGYRGSAADNRLLLLYMNERATWQLPSTEQVSPLVGPNIPSTRLETTTLQLPENKLFSQYNPLTYSLKPLDFTLSRTPVSTDPYSKVEQNTSTEPASSTIPLGRYSLSEMEYATNSNDDVVGDDDWDNIAINARDIRRNIVKENRRLGREYRNSLRRQIPLLQRSGTNFNELMHQSREAEHAANNKIRQWEAELVNLYRQSRINRSNSQRSEIQTPTFIDLED